MAQTPRQRAYLARRWQKILAMPTIACACGCGEQIPPLTVNSEPARFKRGHNARLPHSPTRTGLFPTGHQTWNKGSYEPPEPRFWSKVDTSKDCWEWTGVLSRGYGQLGIKGRMVLAHRYSYVLHHGPIPRRHCVCHSCDNRRCVNPAHLFLGTHQDNMRDMISKGRQPDQAGEANPAAKLSDDDVRAIRAALDTGPNIARRFGITKSTVYLIRSGQRWPHVR